MSFQSIMGCMRSQSPYLDRSIQTRRRKGIGILGINFDLHDVVRMPFKDLRTIKSTIPIPQFDGHIIGRRQDVGQIGVDFETANVIGMSFKFLDFFHGIVVEYSHSHVIRGSDKPLFSRDKLGASDWEFRDFKGLDATSGFIVPDHDNTGIESGEDPWFGRVQVDGFNTFGLRRKLFLNIQSKRLCLS
jgi:hypothetical protein